MQTYFFNKTRYSVSIPQKLMRERHFHLIPLYYMLRLSYLAKEGIESSGSYRFADHIYINKARGTFGIGVVIDRILLSLPSSRSFRNRYINSRDQILKFLISGSPDERTVLSIPSGIPRELMEAAEILKKNYPDIYKKVRFFCIDMDPMVIEDLRRLTDERGLRNFTLITGNAFDNASYPIQFDVITSTGFGEFLKDKELIDFYNICFSKLKSNGMFITSSTIRHKLSDYLMRNLAELMAIYRDELDLKRIFSQTKFKTAHLKRDHIGYQVFIKATNMI